MQFPKAIEVSIGLAFLFLALTFLASAVVEMAATMVNARGRMLHAAISGMLRNEIVVSVDDVYNHPLVTGLVQDPQTKWLAQFRLKWLGPFGALRGRDAKVRPSYIPAGAFSAVVLEKLMGRGGLQAPTPDGAINAIRNAMKPDSGQPGGVVHSIVYTALATTDAGVQDLRQAIETSYNDTMDRATGWYKRQTRAGLLLVGLCIAFAGNVDSLRIAAWLWQGDGARDAVQAAAADYIRSHDKPPSAEIAAQTLTSYGQQLMNVDQQLFALNYPLGWVGVRQGPLWALRYAMGALITAVAISMGSSFWFDSLQTILKLRGTGPKPDDQ